MESNKTVNATRMVFAGALALASLAIVPGLNATETASAGTCFADVDGVIEVRLIACNAVRCAPDVLVEAKVGPAEAHVDC